MDGHILAFSWGLFAGSALLLGAIAGYLGKITQRQVAAIMAFGSGVLISALSLELMDEAYERGGFGSTATGFLCGAFAYTFANSILAKYGAKHRKRSGNQQPTERQTSGSGLSIALGSIIDGVPESIAIGISLLEGSTVSMATVIAVFLSNVPEGLSSASGMKKAGRTPLYVFGLWGSIALVCGLSSLFGYAMFSGLSEKIIAVTLATAAGAILCMLVDTMIPEAFEETHDFTGLITISGFLTAFYLRKMG